MSCVMCFFFRSTGKLDGAEFLSHDERHAAQPACPGQAEHGEIGMPEAEAGALAALRAFNYERIYVRPESLAQSRAVVAVLRALVDFYAEHPESLPDTVVPVRDAAGTDVVRTAVTYVAGMTDRYAFAMAVHHLGWPIERLPRGIDDQS